MKYTCILCNYDACDITHLNRHYRSKRHIKKSISDGTKEVSGITEVSQSITGYHKSITEVSQSITKISQNDAKKSIIEENYVCDFCGIKFNKKNNFYRHRKHFCKQKEKDNEINNLRMELELVKQEMELTKQTKNTEIDIYKTENEFHKNMTVNAGNVVGKTMSALTYIMTNYNQAPKIKRLDDKSAMKLLMYETKDGKLTKPITGKTPLQYLIDLYEYDKLIPHLGNIIISQYKKSNPKDQAFWNTDSSRLSYVVRDTSGTAKSKKTMWESDKRGIKITEYIINPLLAQIYNLIIEYDKSIYAIFDKMTSSDRDKYVENTKFTLELKEVISKGSLNRELLRHITPYFYIAKKFNE